VATYVICGPDRAIQIVGRNEELPDADVLEMNIPEGGFCLDITEQGDFDTMDIMEISNNYQADSRKKKLIKRKK
jgi:hypothetical protein